MKNKVVKRNKAFLGSIIGAVGGLFGGLLGSSSREEEVRKAKDRANA